MTMYQVWCFRKAQEEHRRRQKVLMYLKLLRKG